MREGDESSVKYREEGWYGERCMKRMVERGLKSRKRKKENR